jgi:MoxR-like ATPase
MLKDRFLAIESEMNEIHLERADVVRSLVVAVLARAHVVLLGPPGTGKSRLARDIAARIGGRCFEWLLTRMTTPEELFGPMSLKALENDSYRRITTGKLPEAHIAFLDEVFKGSSAILNTLLAVVNERVFHNDGEPTPVPLVTVIGASNELPEDREELGALWDRFLLRHVVGYIKDPAAFERMLTTERTPKPRTTVTMAELEQAQREVAAVDLSDVLPVMIQLRGETQRLGIAVSDRRWHDATAVIQANAWLNGHAAATEDDLAILQHVLWQEPEQRAQVAKTVLLLVSPFEQEAQDLMDQAQEAYQAAIAAPEDQQNAAGLEANKTLKLVAKRLEQVAEKARAAGKPCRRAEDGVAAVQAWQQEVLAKCLGVKVS